MDFLSNIGSFFSNIFHSVECYFQPEAEACKAPAQETAGDHFEAIKSLDHARLEELIHQSQPVRVGCYIEMHEVRDYGSLRDAIQKQAPKK